MRRVATFWIALALIVTGTFSGRWSIWCSMARATVTSCCCERDDADDPDRATSPTLDMACCQLQHESAAHASAELPERESPLTAPVATGVVQCDRAAPARAHVASGARLQAASLPPPEPERSLLAIWIR